MKMFNFEDYTLFQNLIIFVVLGSEPKALHMQVLNLLSQCHAMPPPLISTFI
jgi:hypothetical protein